MSGDREVYKRTKRGTVIPCLDVPETLAEEQLHVDRSLAYIGWPSAKRSLVQPVACVPPSILSCVPSHTAAIH